jgi:hypothetical protein
MSDLLKDRLNHKLLSEIALDIQSVYNSFQVDAFLKTTMDKTWDDLELKDRIYRVSINLGKFLPTDYKTAIGIIDKVVMNYGNWLDGIAWFFPIFVEIYGQDEVNWDISIAFLNCFGNNDVLPSL